MGWAQGSGLSSEDGDDATADDGWTADTGGDRLCGWWTGTEASVYGATGKSDRQR